MEISRIRIGGFRNISEMNVSFDEITALVGLNGYGKSNVIDAIDFGFDFIQYSNTRKESLMMAKNCIPLLTANVGKDYLFEIESKVSDGATTYYVLYSFSFSWKTAHAEAGIKSELLKIKKEGKNQKYNTYISRSSDSAYYRTSETGRCDRKIKIESNALIINKLLALDDLYYLPIVEQINANHFYIERHLDASSSFDPDPFVIKGFKELELQGIQSIPRAIYYLKKDYPQKYELLVNAFKLLFPNVIDLKVREIKLNQSAKVEVSDDAPFVFTDSIYLISITDKRLHQPIRFEQLSNGTKRVFLTLTVAIIADIKNLSMIAIEEPENSIHPRLFQSYIDIITQLVDGCKIIFTSHSPYIIQYLNPQSIYVGISNETGEVNFKKIAATKVHSLLTDAAKYDSSVGDYIFTLISSETDDSILEYCE
nr:AAA family ATPase [Clostridia bacterium]